MHTPWLINVNKPRELNSKDMVSLAGTVKILKESNPEWKFYLYTNHPEMLITTKDWAKANGFDIKNI